jgi:hypothetical protein
LFGLFFVAVGIAFSLLHRPAGWLMFKISHVFPPWREFGLEGARTLNLGLGLVLIAIGCIYLIRSII